MIMKIDFSQFAKKIINFMLYISDWKDQDDLEQLVKSITIEKINDHFILVYIYLLVAYKTTLPKPVICYYVVKWSLSNHNDLISNTWQYSVSRSRNFIKDLFF